MSALAKSSREAMKAKARAMAGGHTDPHRKVDSSDWTPEEPMNTGKKRMPAPVNPRAFKAGGKVEGDKAKHRADRKGRSHKDTGGPLAGSNDPRRAATQFMMNAANQAPVQPTMAIPALSSGKKSPLRLGLKKGGATHSDEAADKALIKKMVKSDCRTARKHGGRTNAKGKTNINIIIAQPGKGGDMGMAPPVGPAPRPPALPPSMPPNAPPASMGPGAAPAMMPPPGPPGLMARRHGGRTNYPIDTGSGGGQARLDKIKAYGLTQKDGDRA